jgi:hypothetical protein
MSGQLHSPAAFTSRKLLPIVSVVEVQCALEPVWTSLEERIKFLTSKWVWARGNIVG